MAARPGNLVRMPRVLGAGVVVVALLGRAQAADLAIVVNDPAGNRLQDAVVFADALDAPPDIAIGGETNPPSATIAQVNKQFRPYVSAIRVGTVVDFPNRDHILHNVYSFSKVKSFQLPLYKDKPPVSVIFDTPDTNGANVRTTGMKRALTSVLPP